MFLHLGEDVVIYKKDIVGIFDIENTTIDKDTRDFLKKAQEENIVITVSSEMPKSFIITEAFMQEGLKSTVYISHLSPITLEKRVFGGLLAGAEPV